MHDEVRRAADLRELVGDYTELTGSSPAHLRGRCPLHDDRNPSLSVNAAEGLWYCFGCGAGGSVFDWVMAVEHISYAEAVRYVARRFGVPLPDWSEEVKATYELEAAVCRLLAEVAGTCARAFPGSPAADYLRSRGIAPEVAPEVGWCESYRQIVEIAHRYPAEVVIASGLYSEETARTRSMSEETQRRWARRLVVPQVLRGRTVNLWTRAIAPDAPDWLKNRYLNGRPQIGFWVDVARRSSLAAVAEGAIDALSLRTVGYEGACALGGTGDPERLRSALGRHPNLVLVPDADLHEDGGKPGQAAALRLAADLLRHGIQVGIADLTRGNDAEAPTDPNDLLRMRGADALRAAVDAPLSPYEFRRRWGLRPDVPLLLQDGSELVLRSGGIDYRCVHVDTRRDEHGIRVALQVRDARNRNALAMDSIPLYSSRRRHQLAREVAAGLGLDDERRREAEERIAEDLLQLQDELQKWVVAEAQQNEETGSEPVAMSEAERAEALELLQSPNLLERVVADAQRLGVVGENAALMIGWLVLCSRLTDEPLYLTVKGESSAGKSFSMGVVIRFAPEDHVRDLSRVTPQALFYVPPDWAKHRLLFVRERIGGEGADYAIRTMLSERGLTLLVTERDEGDHLQARERIVEGPIAYIETTTETTLNVENETRLLELYLDESAEQTARIHDRQREEATLLGLQTQIERELILRRQRNAQRLLQRVHVVVPYAPLLSFPTSAVRQRRDHEKFLRLLRVIAFVHQYRKERHIYVAEGGREIQYIMADLDDYREAYALAPDLFGATMDELDRRTRQVLSRLWDYAGRRHETLYGQRMEPPTPQDRQAITFTRREAALACNMPLRAVRRHLDVLVEMEFLIASEGGQGRAYHYRLNIDNPDRPMLSELTTPDELEELIARQAAGEAVEKSIREPEEGVSEQPDGASAGDTDDFAGRDYWSPDDGGDPWAHELQGED